VFNVYELYEFVFFDNWKLVTNRLHVQSVSGRCILDVDFSFPWYACEDGEGRDTKGVRIRILFTLGEVRESYIFRHYFFLVKPGRGRREQRDKR